MPQVRAEIKAALLVAFVAVAASVGGGLARAQDEEPAIGADMTADPATLRAAPAPLLPGPVTGKPGAPAVAKPAAPVPPLRPFPPAPPSAPAALAASAGQKKVFQNFSDLRAEVLDVIGAATGRIWIVTDYLTDGETVSALYIAQYRKLDVKVLLGRSKANHYMSRLNYLKNQNIPVYLKPDNFKIPGGGATAIIADGTLVTVDGELDFLAKYKKFNLAYGAPAETPTALAAFAEALNAKVPAIPHQMPLVGKPNPKGTFFTAPPAPNFTGVDTGGSFKYDRKAEKRPSGVPDKLPKAPKWQQKTN